MSIFDKLFRAFGWTSAPDTYLDTEMPLKYKVCACGRPILPHRRKWCCDECMNKARNERRRKHHEN